MYRALENWRMCWAGWSRGTFPPASPRSGPSINDGCAGVPGALRIQVATDDGKVMAGGSLGPGYMSRLTATGLIRLPFVRAHTKGILQTSWW
jgi:hypothetical protein